MASSTVHRFTSRIVRRDDGYHVLPVPDAVAQKLRAAKVTRLLVKLGAQECRRALQNHADGAGFIYFGRDALAELGLRRDEPLAVELRPDPAPDKVDIPLELELALEQDADARAIWNTFTPGRRRSIGYLVASAKQEATRIKRAWSLVDRIRSGTLQIGRPRRS